jgi:uncharacterized membrane protein
MAQLRQDPPQSLESAIVVELPIEKGFVLLRAFVADDSFAEAISASLASANCAAPLE